MIRKNALTLAAALAGSVGLSAQGAVVYGVGSTVDNANDGTAVSYTLWSTVGVDGTATSYTSAPIAGTVDGVAFTYTITVAAAGTSGNLDAAVYGGGDESLAIAAAGGGDIGGGTANQMNTGDGFTVTIGDVTDSDVVLDVVFDGFVHFSLNNTANNEGAVLNGVTYTRVPDGHDSRPSFFIDGAPVATFEAISIGTTLGRAVDFQFSTVPEPGSLALLSLGGLFMWRRRRS